MRISSKLLFLLLCLPVPARGQSTEDDIKSRLADKPLYLRGSWRDDKLHFSSTGNLIGKPAQTTFTLSGFDFRKVQLKHDKLLIEGRRVGLEFFDNKPKRVTLVTGDPRNPDEETIRIEIDAGANGDYSLVLDTIFIEGLTGLVPTLPFYWKDYAIKNLLPADPAALQQSAIGSPVTTAPPAGAPSKLGAKISAPKLLRSVEPGYNNTARALRYSGISLVHLWVGADGKPTHLSVLRPLGLGLDEIALGAVQQYVFQPAMQDGKPVLVELNIELNFQIF